MATISPCAVGSRLLAEIAAFGQNLAVAHDRRAEGIVAALGLRQCQAHEALVVSGGRLRHRPRLDGARRYRCRTGGHGRGSAGKHVPAAQSC
jgi:hypothetical protein